MLHATVFAGHDDAVLSARFSPDGQQIVTASRDRTASLWDVATGNRLRQFEEGHEFLATSAVFFPDGSRLATGAGDNSVRIWDVARGTQLAVLTPTGRIGTLAVSPDGNWIATGSPGTDAQVWDSHSGTQVGAPLAGHVAEVSAAAFSPSGDPLATGDDRGHIRLWRKTRPAGDWTLAHELRGHSRSITALRFTPDGQRLVSASGDHTCGQWDVATGAEERAARAQASRIGHRRSTSRPTARSRSRPATTASRGSGGWPTRKLLQRSEVARQIVQRRELLAGWPHGAGHRQPRSQSLSLEPAGRGRCHWLRQ